MSKKVELWDVQKQVLRGRDSWELVNYLVDPSDVEDVIWANALQKMDNVSVLEIPVLNSLADSFKKHGGFSLDNFIEALNEGNADAFEAVDPALVLNFKGRGLEYNGYADGLAVPCAEVVFDYDANNRFYNLEQDYDTVRVYQWWDGSNYKILFTTDFAEYEISEEYVDLDEWDGNNHTTGGLGEHASVYKVLGETDMYLLHEWSQWQGSHPTGVIKNSTELREYLKLIRRDVEDYMEQISALGER